jgi:hypothetical protein
MKLKNISARAYGVNGKIIAPLETFEVTDELTMASIKMHIGGDFVEVADEEKKKPGRPAKVEKDTE